MAGGLRERGVVPGDTVALMLPTGLDFLAAFQGILLAGGIPVPIYPPARLDRLEEYAARQSAILADAGVKVLLTVARARAVAALLRPRVPTPARTWPRCASWPRRAPPGRSRAVAGPTPRSSSTPPAAPGAPKGVLLTHANLLANITAVGAGAADDRRRTWARSGCRCTTTWGSSARWLFCMHAALPIAIQSPLRFLSRPERWLWTIHDRRATLSPAPNFAYELCVKKIPDRALEGLDLSSWRVALNGAEPVNPETIDRFVKRFEPYGFRREAMMPVYGLAENSVAVCFPPPGRGPVRRRDRARRVRARAPRRCRGAGHGSAPLRFVSVGPAVGGHEVRIVDDAGREVADRTVGRLAFRGPSMTSGYFRKPEATAAIRVDGRIPRQRRPGLPRRRRVLRHRPAQGPDHQGRAQPRPAGDRGDRVHGGGHPQGLRGRVRGLAARPSAPRSWWSWRRRGPPSPPAREALQAKVIERVATAIGVPPDTVVLARPGAC